MNSLQETVAGPFHPHRMLDDLFMPLTHAYSALSSNATFNIFPNFQVHIAAVCRYLLFSLAEKRAPLLMFTSKHASVSQIVLRRL